MDNWLQTRAELLHGDEYFPKLEPAGEKTCQVFKSSAGEGSDNARVMLLVSIAAARRHIRIANAYFIPDRLHADVTQCVQAGRESGNHHTRARHRRANGPCGGQDALAATAKGGARFYEYQPARFHCKYILVDDCWASVGSADLDNRSLSLNEEANLNVLDEKFVAAYTRVFEEDKSLSREIRWPIGDTDPGARRSEGESDRCSPRRCSGDVEAEMTSEKKTTTRALARRHL